MQRATLLSVLALLAVWSNGCGRAQPTLAGGKPVSYWVEAVKSSDAKLRKEAVFKLGNVGPTDPTAFPAVASALDDQDAKVRCEAILAVLKFGAQAREVVPVLTRLRQDPNSQVRDYAAKALDKLQKESDAR
jgi:HEAT repeat protein